MFIEYITLILETEMQTAAALIKPRRHSSFAVCCLQYDLLFIYFLF